MTRSTTTVDPALIPLIHALVRLSNREQQRESADAADELSGLRAALKLEDDFPAWKRRIEGLMKAFYKHVPEWGEMELKGRVRLVRSAIEELGRTASCRRVALRAGEMFRAERTSSPRRGRKPKAAG